MSFFDVIYIVILATLSYFTFFHLILWHEIKHKKIPEDLKDSELPHVSIIVPAYNEEEVIGNMLKSLTSINYPRNKLEILVIDDGSTDKTYEIARSYKSKLVKVIKKQNTGKASSLNFGIDRSRHDFVAVADADSFLERNALRNCMKYFNENSVASVTSHILVKKKETLWEKLQDLEYMIISVARKAQEQVNLISATPGPLSVYKKKDLIKVGKFDERNLVEDVEISWRLLKHNYKIKMAFDAMVYSLYPSTFSRWWKQRIRWNIGGLQTLFKYLRDLFKESSHGTGNFLVPVSIISYLFVLVGTGAFMYLISERFVGYVSFLITAFSIGLNPFNRFEFTYDVDLLIVYGILIFLVSLYMIRIGMAAHNKKPNVLLLMPFLTIYPLLLIMNLLTSIYAFVTKKRGWMTK